MAEENQQRQRFDRVMGTLHGLPDVRETRPTTIMEAVPIINEVTTAVVQTYRSEEDGFIIFVQLVDSIGHRAALVDRSTPESRRRKAAARDRERKRAEKAARQAAWRRRNPEGRVG